MCEEIIFLSGLSGSSQDVSFLLTKPSGPSSESPPPKLDTRGPLGFSHETLLLSQEVKFPKHVPSILYHLCSFSEVLPKFSALPQLLEQTQTYLITMCLS